MLPNERKKPFEKRDKGNESKKKEINFEKKTEAQVFLKFFTFFSRCS
jgi:hypothetical protein